VLVQGQEGLGMRAAHLRIFEKYPEGFLCQFQKPAAIQGAASDHARQVHFMVKKQRPYESQTKTISFLEFPNLNPSLISSPLAIR
jgi:hypothetical protein